MSVSAFSFCFVLFFYGALFFLLLFLITVSMRPSVLFCDLSATRPYPTGKPPSFRQLSDASLVNDIPLSGSIQSGPVLDQAILQHTLVVFHGLITAKVHWKKRDILEQMFLIELSQLINHTFNLSSSMKSLLCTWLKII